MMTGIEDILLTREVYREHGGEKMRKYVNFILGVEVWQGKWYYI